MRKLTRKYKVIILFISLLLIGIIIAFVLNTKFSVLQRNPFSTSKLNILVSGYDSSLNGSPRADTIILASIDLKTKGVGLLFVPRDTRMKIPGQGYNRVNASHAFGGIKLLKETLESYLDIPIDYYVETDFEGFARIIDILGGIRVEIEEPLHYVDKAGDLYIDLPAGNVLLNGEKALQYVRYREPLYGDIGRVERQQKFIKALMKRVLSSDIIIKLPALYKEMTEAVNTNIPFQDISPFFRLAKNLDMNQVKTAMVPGEPKYINGASYWIADREEVEILVNNLIRSKEYIRNSHYYVSLYNGNGEPGVAGELADELNKYGFKIDKIGNASNFNYKETIIKYYDPRDKSTVIGIQELIGGKIKHIEDNEKQNKEQQEGLKIIIGADFLQKRNSKGVDI